MFNFIESGKHILCVNSDLSVVLCYQNMVLELKFSRFESSPWGFRLTGGSDFELPLTVIKVSKGSIAEEAGLKVDDVIVRINDTPTSNLSHNEAHEIIMKCGNNFVIAVLRPDEDGSKELPTEETNKDDLTNGINETKGTPSPYRQIQTPDSQAYSDMSEVTIHTNHTESASEEAKSEEITDDHIAEMMSGEAEVLKEHNVIGVNFQRIIPKAGLFKSSEVFKHLNEEAMKTKAEKDQETKKWTTFLQKPNRPIPKSKFDLEREKQKAEGYKIVICKQPKPKCDPNRPATPPPPVVDPEPEPEPIVELVPEPAPQYVEYLNEEIVDSETRNSETIDLNSSDEHQEPNEEVSKEDAPAEDMVQPTEDTTNSISTPPKTDEELMIERQLADVQKQLLALSSLPYTIQATLDAVTKQLAELVPALKQTSQTTVSDAIGEDAACSNGEICEEAGTVDVPIDETENEAKSDEVNADIVIEEIVDEVENNECEPTVESFETIASPEITQQEEIEKQRMEKVFKKQEEEWINKKEKIEKWNKIWSWTDETKGHMYRIRESNCSLLESRIRIQNEINFLKYKKPEKDLSNLNRSEVFKIIHNIEKDPKHGIQVRPPKVLAEEDVRNCSTPIHCA